MSFFLPYQIKWLEDKSRIKLMQKSRQIGMSWTAAYQLVRTHSLSTYSRDSWVSSRDELQAKLFIDDCKKFARILNLATLKLLNKEISKEGDSKSLEFANGTKIWSLSSNPDAQAGKRGTRLLDEFALHPDPALLYAIAYPGITWGGSLQIISTHRGANNFFNKLVEEILHQGNPKNISLHTVTLADALDQGFLEKLKNNLSPEDPIMDMDCGDYFDYIRNSCVDDESFQQEYMCKPSDDMSSFINFEILQRCLYKKDEDWQKISSDKNFLYLGVDLGRSKDLSVFWLLEKVGDVLCTRDILTLKDVPFSEQELHLHKYLQMPNLRKACIDQSGLGRQFAERATQRYGSSRVEGVSFTSLQKEILAYPLKAKFEDAKIRIPDELEVLSDICAIRKECSGSGNIRLFANRTSDGHSDRFWALALANYAVPSGESKMQLVGHRYGEFIW